MQIDRVKISQEINFNGMPTWVGMEGLLDPDEDPKEGLRTIQRKITEYQQEEQTTFGKSKWGRQGQPEISMVDDMRNCKTEDEILSFRLTIKTPEQQAVYEEVLSELTNKK
jgi:hypothetical protein